MQDLQGGAPLAGVWGDGRHQVCDFRLLRADGSPLQFRLLNSHLPYAGGQPRHCRMRTSCGTPPSLSALRSGLPRGGPSMELQDAKRRDGFRRAPQCLAERMMEIMQLHAEERLAAETSRKQEVDAMGKLMQIVTLGLQGRGVSAGPRQALEAPGDDRRGRPDEEGSRRRREKAQGVSEDVRLDPSGDALRDRSRGERHRGSHRHEKEQAHTQPGHWASPETWRRVPAEVQSAVARAGKADRQKRRRQRGRKERSASDHGHGREQEEVDAEAPRGADAGPAAGWPMPPAPPRPVRPVDSGGPARSAPRTPPGGPREKAHPSRPRGSAGCVEGWDRADPGHGPSAVGTARVCRPDAAGGAAQGAGPRWRRSSAK